MYEVRIVPKAIRFHIPDLFLRMVRRWERNMYILHSEIYNIILAANTTEILPPTLVNILIGIGIVLAVLICILIYLINKVNTFANKYKPGETVFDAVNLADAQINVKEGGVLEEELVNDTELVAVITAAIMASMGNEAPADGLIVRSIRRMNSRKWQNA